MKTLIITIGLSALCCGCVRTQYMKTVSVTKDADGKVINTVYTEQLIQPNRSATPMQFEYMKNGSETAPTACKDGRKP